MHPGTLLIDGREYVVLPKADYLRLVPGETVDAMAFTLSSIGSDLKAAREHAGFTQAQLAKKLKKAQTTVSKSEAGKIRVSEKYILKVLEICGLPEDWKAPR